MITRNIVRNNMYLDSIMLMSLSSTLKELEGVDEASVIMGSETNKEILEGIGLLTQDGRGAKPGDVIIAVRAKDRKGVDQIVARAEELLSVRSVENQERKAQLPRSYEAAIDSFPAANLALISLPGQYAGREAMKVLDSGRHVMIFSDNVPLEEAGTGSWASRHGTRLRNSNHKRHRSRVCKCGPPGTLWHHRRFGNRYTGGKRTASQKGVRHHPGNWPRRQGFIQRGGGHEHAPGNRSAGV